MRNNKTTDSTARKQDRIAIVGVACRFPGGVVSLDDYWRVLSGGQDVVTEIPEERFGKDFFQHPNRKEPGKSVTFAAGVLDNVENFDAAFFGISPREAEQMDPQQRLLLELTWEALENGDQVPEKLAGSDCAVYVAIASNDYLNRRVDDPASMDAYTMTGNTASIASNRISYVFDLQGPSVSVDTACSSSLVAVHHACQAIRSGEASMAIAGGVNMLLHPLAFVGFSQASMLSERGRCRTFDASGDGYVRAEGAAILFLKPLEQAEADGDPIHAVIVASGVNADGKTNGMTVPSYNQQGNLLRKVYAEARVDVNDLVYLEAHGTGTAIGDPIETRAIGEAIGRARTRPLLIGSAKSNVGHLETASGMAGLVKAMLVLKHQALPPSLHVETVNPRIEFDDWNLRIVTELTPLPANGQRQLVGINSFGFGGANAHVLIESRQASSVVERSLPVEELLPPLFLSARSDAALKAMAGQYAELLKDESQSVYDLAYGLVTRRQHLSHGAVISAVDRETLLERLQAYAGGELNRQFIAEGRLLASTTPLVLVFSGNGSQWQGMGQTLLTGNPVFRAAVQDVDKLLSVYADYSLLDEFAASKEESRLHLTEIAQPLLFALQVGMVRILQAQGVKIHATIGHSVGEVAAAWAAGALSLEQAVRVIYQRSRAQGKTRGLGRMAAVGLGQQAIQDKLLALGMQAQVEIAGVNSPHAVTLSATLEDLETLAAALEEGTFFRILDLDYAFHSHWMEPVQQDLLDSLHDLQPVNADTGILFMSTVYGQTVAGSQLDARYWWENIRQPVAFEAGVNALIAQGAQVFMEVGPHPILRSYLNECMREQRVEGHVLATGQRKGEHADSVRQAAFTAWTLGCGFDWQVLFPHAGRRVALPNYPWQKERYWYPLTSEGPNLVNRRRVHPLLGYRLKEAEAVWENQIDTARIPYLADHVVDGAVIVPAAAYVEMALAASAQWFESASHVLENFEIRAPILLEEGHGKVIRFNLLPGDGSFSISSRERLSDDAWTLNVVGRLTGAALKDAANVALPGLAALKAGAEEVLSGEMHYQLTEAVGLTYLSAFQGVEQVWVHEQEALAALQVRDGIAASLADYLLHPSLLDAGFQVLVDIFRAGIRGGKSAALIPIQIGKLNFFAATGPVRYLHVRIRKSSPRSVLADFLLLNDDNELIAELEGARFRGVQFARARQAEPAAYEFVSRLKPLVRGDEQAVSVDREALAQAGREAVQEREADWQRSKHYQQIAPLFEVLASAFAWEAMSALFAGHAGGATLDDLHAAGVAREQAPLLQHLLSLLADDGLAGQEDGIWCLADESGLPAAHDIWLAILGDSPAHLPELVMLGRCGEHLLPVLRGELDPVQLLTPAKSSIEDHWLDSAPGFRAMNLALAAMVRNWVAQWPAQKRLRILEVGGGNAALTQLILPLLPAERCTYVFTDTDETQVLRAAGEFEDYPFLQASMLKADLTGETMQQLQQAERFDLVIASSPLHDWGDVHAVMPRLQTLLKPQAMLMLAGVQDSRFFALTQGLQPHWWLPVEFDGQEYYASRLHSPQEWQAVLREAGFAQPLTVYEPTAADDEAGAFVLLATAEQGNTTALLDAPVSHSWLLLADEQGYSAELAQRLQAGLLEAGQQVVLQTGFDLPEQVDQVVHLAGMSFETPADLLALQERRCFSTVELVQALDQRASASRLWLVTAGAMPAAGSLQPAQVPLWGLGRVLMNEHPDLGTVLIDVQGALSADVAAERLLQECLYPDGEEEILLGAEGRHVLRMHKTGLTGAQEQQAAPAVCLDFTSPGPLKHLYWRALPAQDLQPDEIEIRPHASGLNFRDVMYAMGLLSDEAVENGFAGASLGMELSGEVVRAGSAVTDFRAGDAVIGFAPACFSTRVITRTTAVAHKPAAWTDEEAATIPTTFFTVYYALHHLAQLQPGERVLIHGASGGVGLAAIQFARYRGAEVFATAGTDEKREFVRLMGADHVMDSRSLRFAEEVMQLTGGKGVDIVLNSISGEAINKNLAILRPFGRFLELGKRDFYENSKIGLRPFRNNISYFGIDADQLLIERPELAGRLFREMMSLFREGVLRPLPHRVFPAARIHEAFRYMQQSRQIGKVIVSFTESELRPTFPASHEQHLQLDAGGSYLVTGGLSGFGLQTARWLADKGARTLVLMSRSGAASDEARQAIADLEAGGVQVEVYACDVTDRQALRGAMDDMLTRLPPLRGLVHAAMVLDDGIVRNLTADSFRKVLAPKMLGAWYLHEWTAGLTLDFFVMYSSVTTYLGNPGQANYVAANMFLESLAHCRRQQGLPATYAAWGAIADAGYLARNAGIRDALQSRLGGEALTTARALGMLEKLLLSGKTGAAVVDFDWNAIQRVMPAARSARYEEQRRLAKAADEGEQGDDIQTLIAGLSLVEVQALVAEMLLAEVGKILRLPRDKLAADKSVFDLGMDSLMGMELVLAIEERFGVRLPVMALTEGATVQRIAERIAAHLLPNEDAAVSTQDLQQQSIAELARKHGSDLSADELAQLAENLSAGQTGNNT